jgi:hypothetical protein
MMTLNPTTPLMGINQVRIEEKRIEKRKNLIALVNIIAILAIPVLGAVYTGTCWGYQPANAYPPSNITPDGWAVPDPIVGPYKNNTWWCTVYEGYESPNRIARCVKDLENAPHLQAMCWKIGGLVYGLVAVIILIGTAGINCCCWPKSRVIPLTIQD